MVKLNCTARKCVNNEGGLCGARYIMIESRTAKTTSETYCSNFKENNIVSQLKALGNTNYVGEIEQMLSDNSEMKIIPEVSCHAVNCFYNIDEKCKASDVSIMGDNAEVSMDTSCETYIE